MGLMISVFDALTMLPPKQESFKCYWVIGGDLYYRQDKNLEDVSAIASENYTADFGYRKRANSEQLGFRMGDFWFPVTKAQGNRMLKRYRLEIDK